MSDWNYALGPRQLEDFFRARSKLLRVAHTRRERLADGTVMLVTGAAPVGGYENTSVGALDSAIGEHYSWWVNGRNLQEIINAMASATTDALDALPIP